MDLWYSSPLSVGTDFRIKVRRSLFTADSAERRIDVFETEDFGKVLALDGRIAMSEREDGSCREMAVHVPLNVHLKAASVLVVGGGDGAFVSELVQHRGIERITVVEPDEAIVEVARRWFPSTASSFQDSRVRLVSAEPACFVRDAKERFDVVIIGWSDGPAGGEGPLAQSFYCDCFRILAGDGVLVHKAGTNANPQQRRDLMARAGKVKRLFPVYRLFRAYQPAGEPGELLLGFASKRYDPVADFDDSGWESMAIETKYYNPSVHRAAFALPRYFEDLLAGI